MSLNVAFANQHLAVIHPAADSGAAASDAFFDEFDSANAAIDAEAAGIAALSPFFGVG